MSTICILKNLRIGEAKDLPDIEIKETSKKIIGRNIETKIESSSVSREHSKYKRFFTAFLSDCFDICSHD